MFSYHSLVFYTNYTSMKLLPWWNVSFIIIIIISGAVQYMHVHEKLKVKC